MNILKWFRRRPPSADGVVGGYPPEYTMEQVYHAVHYTAALCQYNVQDKTEYPFQSAAIQVCDELFGEKWRNL